MRSDPLRRGLIFSVFSVAQSSLAVASFLTPSLLLRPLPLLSLQTLTTASSAMSDVAPVAPDSVHAADSDDLSFGFRRPEMYKNSLANTVDPPYDRHVFLCHKNWESWPSRVEDSQSDPLPKLFATALKSRKSDISIKTRLTIFEGGDGTESSEGDVLIFPDMIKYSGLKELDVESFVEDVLVNGNTWGSGVQEMMTGSHVFVCAHVNRDRRCGVCGPVLIEKFKEEVEVRGLKDQVYVRACSHIGGHKYAGNLIIFSLNPEGKIMGHWYGYVTPADVPELLDQHIKKGEIIERLWRGQMGAPPKSNEGEAVKEDKRLHEKKSKKIKKKLEEIGSQGTACCQGANGFSCCKDENLDKPGKEGLGKLSQWLGTWEQADVLAGIAVVGAVATVALAYSIYKKSG